MHPTHEPIPPKTEILHQAGTTYAVGQIARKPKKQKKSVKSPYPPFPTIGRLNQRSKIRGQKGKRVGWRTTGPGNSRGGNLGCVSCAFEGHVRKEKKQCTLYLMALGTQINSL